MIASYDGIFGSVNLIARAAGLDPSGLLRVETVALNIPAGSSVAQQIGKFGFAPDASNLALVQYINPQIRDISKVSQDQTVFFPKIEKFSGGTWQTLSHSRPIDGYAVDFRYAPMLKERIYKESIYVKYKLSDVIDKIKSSDHENDAADLKLFDNLYSEISSTITRTPQGDNFSKSVGEFDNYLSSTSKKIDLAHALIEAQNKTGGIDQENTDAFNALVASLPNSDSDRTVNVTLRTVERDGHETPGLRMRYMSSGAYKIGCDRNLAGRFAQDSVNASQVLPSAAWYVWAEDPIGKRQTKPMPLDLTKINKPILSEDYILDWE